MKTKKTVLKLAFFNIVYIIFKASIN